MRLAGTWKQYSKNAMPQLIGYKDDFEERRLPVPQMSVPGKSHENVGDGKQHDRGHIGYAALNDVSFPVRAGVAWGNSGNVPFRHWFAWSTRMQNVDDRK
jgi:hypothetical protein